MHELVHRLKENYGLLVFHAPVFVGDPLAVFAAVVTVQHGRHGINAQTVNMEIFQPEERIGNKEIFHLMPAEIENKRAPILMFPFARVLVLIQVRSVEIRQTISVFGKMPRHPIHDDADILPVHVIDKVLEISGRAEPVVRRVKAPYLVSPRRNVRMVLHRQQLDVRKPHFLDILCKGNGQVVV